MIDNSIVNLGQEVNEGGKEMRRSDREEALRIVDECLYANMAMATKSGKPYCIPISIARDGEEIIIHAAKEGKKMRHEVAGGNDAILVTPTDGPNCCLIEIEGHAKPAGKNWSPKAKDLISDAWTVTE